MKKKIIIIVLILIACTFLTSITYSFFHTNANITTVDQEIAKFIFNAEKVDEISVPLMNLVPGEIKNYEFSVYNSNNNKVSDLSIEYELTIKTPHLIPLSIKLYKGNSITPLINCDESYSTNSNNEFVCNSTTQEINHGSIKQDDYRLEVKFIDGYNSERYSDLVDYIDISIKSWQKLEG